MLPCSCCVLRQKWHLDSLLHCSLLAARAELLLPNGPCAGGCAENELCTAACVYLCSNCNTGCKFGIVNPAARATGTQHQTACMQASSRVRPSVNMTQTRAHHSFSVASMEHVKRSAAATHHCCIFSAI